MNSLVERPGHSLQESPLPGCHIQSPSIVEWSQGQAQEPLVVALVEEFGEESVAPELGDWEGTTDVGDV